jgi:hypothetical protein
VLGLLGDEEEEDVFAGLADDENDSEDWRGLGKGRSSMASNSVTTDEEDTLSRSPHSSTSSTSIQNSRSRAASVSDRGSRASLAFGIDEKFVEDCRKAAARHRGEMKGWRSTLNKRTTVPNPGSGQEERGWLYEIRAIARRNYGD